MNGNEIDMRMFAQRAGASVGYPAGSIVFKKDDPGSCMYIVQSGVIEMLIGDTVVETCGPNEATGLCRWSTAQHEARPRASRRRASFR
jgi:CRP-like cAMP-binding protein